MFPMFLVAFALAGAGRDPSQPGTVTRTCSSASASANVHASWEVLGHKGRDDKSEVTSDAGQATATVRAEWGGERSEDLCPQDDPMGGLKAATDTMLEVQLPKPGEPRSCMTTARAVATGGSTAQASVDPALRVSARASADMAVDVTNSATMGADVGSAGTFTGVWAWRGKGPNTDVRGTVTISAGQAYARAAIEVPGLLKAQVYEGKVDAWVRQGDHYEHVQADAPITLEPYATLAGGKGSLCVTGNASMGGVADDRMRALAAESVLEAAFRLALSEQYPALPTGEQPEFGPCGCE